MKMSLKARNDATLFSFAFSLLFASLAPMQEAIARNCTSSEVEVALTPAGDVHLLFELTNISNARLAFHPSALPWADVDHIVTLLGANPETESVVRSDSEALIWLGPGKTVYVAPGQTVSKSIDLSNAFSRFLEARRSGRMVLFWQFTPTIEEGAWERRLGSCSGAIFYGSMSKERDSSPSTGTSTLHTTVVLGNTAIGLSQPVDQSQHRIS